MAQRLVIIMGPSGAGKSTIASALADIIPGAVMLEADDFHSAGNRKQMQSGQALSDADRQPWVDTIRDAIIAEASPTLVLACSALTPMVQDRLRDIPGRQVRFFLLHAAPDILARRMSARTDHFMPSSLLRSQLETLDPPADATLIDASQHVGVIAREIAEKLDHEA